MVRFAETKYVFRDGPLGGLPSGLPVGAGLAGVLALGWWWLLGLPLRRNLRSALGGAALAGQWLRGEGPPVRPRRPKTPRHNPCAGPRPAAPYPPHAAA